jgi:hypothetical protein
VELGSLEDELTDRLAEEFETLEIISAVPTTMSVPDFALYEAARSLYFEAVEARRAAISERAFTAEEERITEESRLDTLRSYGEVLSEFPVLLDYFSLTAEQGVDPLELDALVGADAPAAQPAPETGGQ